MKANLIRVEQADPWYFTRYYYKCIDCGAEFMRHALNERINPYCGECQRKHDTEAQRERNKRKRNDDIFSELENLANSIPKDLCYGFSCFDCPFSNGDVCDVAVFIHKRAAFIKGGNKDVL